MAKKRVAAADPALPLIEAHRRLHAIWVESTYSSDPDDTNDGLNDLANFIWWQLLETVPTTIRGAVEMARHVSTLEQQGVATNMRDGKEHDSCLLALRRVEAFLSSEIRSAQGSQNGQLQTV